MRVKCLGQVDNTMSPDRAPTPMIQSGVESTDHEPTMPPINYIELKVQLKVQFKV